MGTASKVFISYARADGSDVASAVEKELERASFEVWRDTRHLDGFNDFSVEIERAISAADVVVVCITASIAEADKSFVRREINYAESKGKPIVPLRIAEAPVPILINHLTWIDAPNAASLAGSFVSELQRRLDLRRGVQPSADEPGPSVTFVRSLLDDIVSLLEATTAVLLDIAATGWSSSAPMHGGLPSTMRHLYRSQEKSRVSPGIIGQELSESHKRIILHGGPGSGKTTSLLVAAREAANAWLEDQSRRLPVYCRAVDWSASKDEPLIKWLDRSTPILPVKELERALDEGRITLFIDGLDELGTWVSRSNGKKEKAVDPREELIAMLPPQVCVLATSRSQPLESMGLPPGFESLELERITDGQVAQYVSHAPDLGGLFQEDQSLRDMVQTPLTLGLLTFVASHRDVSAGVKTATDRLSPRLRVVHDFTLSRWQHESPRAPNLVPVEGLIGVLGRLATWGESFDEEDLRQAAKSDAIDDASLARTALQLGLLRSTDDQTFTFFHLSFADCYATLHCWKYLGEQEADGWDVRLFRRIAQLDDRRFIAPLTAMAAGGFWRGEFGNEIAVALAAIGTPEDPDVVRSLLNLAGYSGVGISGTAALGRFAARCSDEVKSQFVARFRERAATDFAAIHELVGLGGPGITALVQVYEQLDERDPMRGQIASYSSVRERLRLE